MEPDKELVEKARCGSVACFEELVQRYYEDVFRFIVSRVGNRQDAEDITQTAFLNVYKGIESFDTRYSFKPWLFSIAHNSMVSYLRRKKPNEEFYDSCCPRPSHEKKVDDADHAELVWRAARKLAPDQYSVLWMRYNEEMDNRTIARAMNKSYANVRVLVHRARNNLSRILNEEK